MCQSTRTALQAEEAEALQKQGRDCRRLTFLVESHDALCDCLPNGCTEHTHSAHVATFGAQDGHRP